MAAATHDSGARYSSLATRCRFHTYNCNKRSVTLDIKHADDIAARNALARDVDIMIQNLRPGIVDKVGTGPDIVLQVSRPPSVGLDL
jgi:crotonobetainyl-CoA:carnitine CoA-transferase CaiB-like acyl-CoA transferase